MVYSVYSTPEALRLVLVFVGVGVVGALLLVLRAIAPLVFILTVAVIVPAVFLLADTAPGFTRALIVIHFDELETLRATLLAVGALGAADTLPVPAAVGLDLTSLLDAAFPVAREVRGG